MGALPRYWISFTLPPSACISTCSVRCGAVPMPGTAHAVLPGLAAM
ncbi:Uncharacterised protein [Bordetella pertussis]|nr:Uncharacterised protein [Bordetella pertussis]